MSVPGWDGPEYEAWSAELLAGRPPSDFAFAGDPVVLYAFSADFPESAESVHAFAGSVVPWPTSGDIYAYWRGISRFWGGFRDLVTIEQDIVLRADVLPAFAACPNLWCVYPYLTWNGRLSTGLGCTRFRAEAMRSAPARLIQAVPGTCELCDGQPGCWRHLDVKIMWTLQELGLSPCVHEPLVKHLNPNALTGAA